MRGGRGGRGAGRGTFDANTQRYMAQQGAQQQQLFYPMVMPMFYPPQAYGMPMASPNTPAITQVRSGMRRVRQKQNL